MPPLTAAEQAALEHDYRHGKTRLIRQRSHLVLLASELDSQAAIARGVRGSRATVNRTLQRFRTGGRPALPRRDTRRVAALWQPPLWRARLTRAMEAGPRACGVPRPTWTAPRLGRSGLGVPPRHLDGAPPGGGATRLPPKKDGVEALVSAGASTPPPAPPDAVPAPLP